MNSGALSARWQYLGFFGTGNFVQNGGNNTQISELHIGYVSGAVGRYDLVGGSVDAASEFIGDFGTGRFVQSGGSNTASGGYYAGVFVGASNGSTGTYELSGTGQLFADHEYISKYIHEETSTSNGRFCQTGGSNTATYVSIGSPGRFEFSGGNLHINSGFNNEGTVDFGGGPAVMNAAANTLVNFARGAVTNTAAASLNIGSNSLLVISPGFDPTHAFANYSNAGMTHVAGTPLIVGTGQGFSGTGYIDDHVDCQGTITAGTNDGIHIIGGLMLSGNGTVNLGGGGTLIVNDTTSGISSGSFSAWKHYVSNSGTATFTQTGGSSHLGDWLYVGYSAGSHGTYNLSNGALYSGAHEIIGENGTGIFNQTGGTNTLYNTIMLGDHFGSNGTYNLTSGSLAAFEMDVASGGAGTFNQNGGTVALEFLSLGNGSNVQGTYNQRTGTLTMTKGYERKFTIGAYGSGIFNYGNATSTGSINETGTSGSGCDLIVRRYSAGSGTLRGWGVVGLTGSLQNNGRIIADGYGTERTLDLSSFSSLSNTIENTTTNGWFAQNGGKLTLRATNVTTGSQTANWGESASDSAIDLVNSIRMSFSNLTAGGALSIDLLAPDRTDVPQAPGISLVGVWDFISPEGFAFNSVDLTFRYDDTLAMSIGIREETLHLYHFVNGQWVDVTSGIDTANDWVFANGMTSFSLYAVGGVPVPEPSSVALLLSLAAVGAAPLVRRWSGRLPKMRRVPTGL